MEALTWSERFLTGLPTVDAQHERLVQLINQFSELNARRASVPHESLDALVKELAGYAHEHFRDEEALMHAAQLDARFMAQHERQHARFLADVEHMHAANFLAAPETARVLVRFLLHWLAFHILGADMQLARQIDRVNRGESAAAAFAAEVHEVEGPSGLLLGALDDFLRVIAQRNAELTEANRTLEQRVVERTASLQATQARLAEAEKLASVGQLASGLAHEINNPLGFVGANVNALAEHARDLLGLVDLAHELAPRLGAADGARLTEAHRAADVDFIRDDLEHLLTETRGGLKRVEAIVRDLKEFTHVDGGARLDLDLRAAVESTLKMLPARAKLGVKFDCEFGATPRVRCHAGQVNQALTNLVTNAAQAVQDLEGSPGVVTIRTGAAEGLVWVEVEDTGVGMTPDVLAHAVEPFFTTRAPGQGLGLGLTTAYNCAQAHGGRLELSSVRGCGSVARLSLSTRGGDESAQPLANSFNTRRYST